MVENKAESEAIGMVRLAAIFSAVVFLGQVILAQNLSITAKSALFADAETGEVLWQRNMNLRCYPASLTKIMTAILILERGKLEDWVKVPKEAAFTGESSMGLKEGERVKMGDLLNAILVRSSNDACVAAAIHIAGSVENFVKWMNEKAKELKMNETNFVNPHGLHDPQHYTTAKDLLLLTLYALRNPIFRSIVAKREILIQPTNKSALRRYQNRNKLLELYPGCDGVKTGYTTAAGKCLVASATRNGWQLIAIVLGSQDHFADCATLLDYGFNNFTKFVLARKGEEIALLRFPNGEPEWLRVVFAETLKVIVPKSQIGSIKSRLVQTKSRPPVSKGEVIGEMIWFVPNASVHKVNLVASHNLNWSRKARAIMMGERILLALVAIGLIQVLLMRRKKKGGRRL